MFVSEERSFIGSKTAKGEKDESDEWSLAAEKYRIKKLQFTI